VEQQMLCLKRGRFGYLSPVAFWIFGELLMRRELLAVANANHPLHQTKNLTSRDSAELSSCCGTRFWHKS
jgi:phage FluMu protein gp41